MNGCLSFDGNSLLVSNVHLCSQSIDGSGQLRVELLYFPKTLDQCAHYPPGCLTISLNLYINSPDQLPKSTQFANTGYFDSPLGNS